MFLPIRFREKDWHRFLFFQCTMARARSLVIKLNFGCNKINNRYTVLPNKFRVLIVVQKVKKLACCLLCTLYLLLFCHYILCPVNNLRRFSRIALLDQRPKILQRNKSPFPGLKHTHKLLLKLLIKKHLL